MAGVDKSRMKVTDRLDPRYEKGVEELLDFAFHEDGRSFRHGDNGQHVYEISLARLRSIRERQIWIWSLIGHKYPGLSLMYSATTSIGTDLPLPEQL
ncbi:hypothetical protein Taro_041491 [Colocasia esculenta]|uniref:Uncharacterized protein n=1 Tax=Colocasia esculenta TaxID=4460 RepID=A0A843WW14_COLES|nr:hypothetical protein [Colocasia esculenta]